MMAYYNMGILNPSLFPHGGQGSAISQARRITPIALEIAGQARKSTIRRCEASQ